MVTFLNAALIDHLCPVFSDVTSYVMVFFIIYNHPFDVPIADKTEYQLFA